LMETRAGFKPVDGGVLSGEAGTPSGEGHLAATLTAKGMEEFNCGGVIHCISAESGYGLSLSAAEKAMRIAYRFFEVVISFFVLLLTLPLMLLMAIIIKADSPGPAFFFQRRVGRSELVAGRDLAASAKVKLSGRMPADGRTYWVPRTFPFVKFRTMYADARQRFPELYDYNYSKEAIERIKFKVDNDPRITRAGRWLRVSTLDELPNFWNVLTGDMRLVGPRPEIPEMLSNYRAPQMYKFTVKPGITGLAQINGRGRLSFQRTVDYDLEYVEKKSVLLDLKIIIMTVWRVVTKHGAF